MESLTLEKRLTKDPIRLKNAGVVWYTVLIVLRAGRISQFCAKCPSHPTYAKCDMTVPNVCSDSSCIQWQYQSAWLLSAAVAVLLTRLIAWMTALLARMLSVWIMALTSSSSSSPSLRQTIGQTSAERRLSLHHPKPSSATYSLLFFTPPTQPPSSCPHSSCSS